MKFEDFEFPYGKLNKEYERVKLAEIIPWNDIEEKYAEKFVNFFLMRKNDENMR